MLYMDQFRTTAWPPFGRTTALATETQKQIDRTYHRYIDSVASRSWGSISCSITGSESVNQSVRERISQSQSESVSQAVSQSSNQSVSQAVDPSDKLSVSQ